MPLAHVYADMSKPRSAVTAVRLPQKSLEELRALVRLQAVRTGRRLTPSAFIRGLVEDYLFERREDHAIAKRLKETLR